jgi:hypothetical protein
MRPSCAQNLARAREPDDNHRVIRLRCPTGCAGFIRRPHALRARPVRCGNCRAWLAAKPEVEDGALVEAVLVARPGEPLAPPRVPWWRRVFARLAG